MTFPADASDYSLPAERQLAYDQLEAEIGNTPLVALKHFGRPSAPIVAKLEYANPTGSHHIRIYPELFRRAELAGLIVPGITPVIECSTGNAGAAMVYCANHLGFNAPEPPSVIVPENISPSRLDLLRQLGAHVIFSPAENYSAGYVAVLESILQEDKKRKGGHAGTNPERLVAITKIRHSARESFYALAEEVLQQLGPLEVLPLSAFVGAVGSGTSISGVGEALKVRHRQLRVVAAEPVWAPVASTLARTGQPLEKPLTRQIVHGVGTFGLTLSKMNLNLGVIDEYVTFTEDDWMDTLHSVAAREGLNFGRSAAGALACADRLAKSGHEGSILIIAYDTSDKAREGR